METETTYDKAPQRIWSNKNLVIKHCDTISNSRKNNAKESWIRQTCGLNYMIVHHTLFYIGIYIYVYIYNNE